MGVAFGRHATPADEDQSNFSNSYKYLLKSGSYFGTHFMLGDERFETPQPECFLFGENKDLNFLCRKPVAYPYVYQSSSEPYQALHCLVIVRRESLKFVKAQTSPADDSANSCRYHIEFILDCDAPCTMIIYYFATETVTSDGFFYSTKRPELTSKPYRFDTGANQVFCDFDHVFDPSSFKPSELLYDQDKEIIPIVIHCFTQPRCSSETPQYHSTIAVAERTGDSNGFTLKPIKQKFYVDNVCYLLQEVYGLENKGISAIGASGQEGSSSDSREEYGAECVVCMSEWRDTLILPCRHLCICSACAQSLRYKVNNCPICRAPFRALLQVKTVKSLVACASAAESSLTYESSSNFNKYELVPLIEALNGPMVPSGMQSLSVGAQCASSARSSSPPAAPRRQNAKKAGRPTSLEVQEVLTPEHIIMRVFELNDKPKCPDEDKSSAQPTSSLYHTSL
uniref:RING-type E3 ubiquitin transferase n=1 Tax=Trichuris muris TaxID=70415 RepID=A0A5S6QS64_TRIMR